ncbi:MAG: hypothetical protein ABSE16_08235 [Verrucomicrobiota bacterium]
MTERNQSLAWRVTVGVFLCLALWPLWSVRFPPMQDYPEHLFHAHMLSVHNDPAFDYNRYYESRIRPVYASFFLTTLFFAKFLPIEIAGKLSLSLYPILVTILVVRLGSRLGREVVPWGALLFFPLMFNQLYFLGTVNFFLSLPILILTLLDYEDFLGGTLSAWAIVRHSLWQVALFITHPFSFLAYVSMATVCAILTRRVTGNWGSKLMASMGVTLPLLVLSWVEIKATPSSEVSEGLGWGWFSPQITMGFFALMFNGMRQLRVVDSVSLILWGVVFAVVLGVLLVDWRKSGAVSLSKMHLVFLVLGIVGLFILPFRIGTFTYINVRVATIIYFLIALLAARVRFRGWLACCLLIGLLGLCMIDSIAKQARISAEVNEILPIVHRIPPNSRILPLVFDHGSPELDKSWFDPHLHDHDYYHVLVGGGFSPYIFGTDMRYKMGEERPAPGEYQPGRFSWEDYSADYQYFLIRGMPDGLDEYMSKTCDKLCVSGSWTLFERKLE